MNKKINFFVNETGFIYYNFALMVIIRSDHQVHQYACGGYIQPDRECEPDNFAVLYHIHLQPVKKTEQNEWHYTSSQ